jgi:acyl-coenzyme A thioesterase PaaI-like protein
MAEPATVESAEHGDDRAIEAARVRAATALRDLGHAFVGRHMTTEQIERLSEALEAVTAELWPGLPRRRGEARTPENDASLPQGRIELRFSDRPMSGLASPWGLDLEPHRVGDEIRSRVVFRAAHEGAPNRCHGGIVASFFDDVFGFVLGVHKQPAFTGELALRYAAPTPLHRPLECRARLVDRFGRKLFMTAELVDVETERVLVTGTATFITVDVDHFLDKTAQRPAPPAE